MMKDVQTRRKWRTRNIDESNYIVSDIIYLFIEYC